MANQKIALVTGGSRGLGKDMAFSLAAKGLGVVLTYKAEAEKADEVVKQITANGGLALALKLDVGDLPSHAAFEQALAAGLQSTFDTTTFDFLINNAGYGGSIPFVQVTEADFDGMLNVHFKGAFFLTQRLLPHMADGGGIVNISTGTTRFTNPGYIIYASMKAAMENVTKYWAKDLGARGIRVNTVAPGGIETDFNNATIRNNPNIQNYLAANTALGRVGQATDIGGVVAFLCTPEAGWINAQRIEVTGGVFL